MAGINAGRSIQGNARVVLDRTAAYIGILIDDLITGGSSIIQPAEVLRDAGLAIHNAVALLDRQAGGTVRLAAEGIRLQPLLKLETLVNYLVSKELITQAQYAQCLTYMDRTEGG